MFSKIGGFAVKFRWWIISGWLLVAALMFLFAPSLSEVGSIKEIAFLPSDSESLKARQLVEQYFPQSSSASSVSLVFFNPSTLGDRDMAYAREVRDWLSSEKPAFKVEGVTSVFDNPQMAANLVSPDNTTMLINAGLEQSAFESSSIETTKAIRDYLKDAPEGLEVYVSGQVGIYGDLLESLNKSIDLTTLVTVLLIIVLLIFIYRSPVAALVPLATIGIAFLVSRGTIGLIGKAGVSIWSQLDVFLIVLVFGIGTDYCLFLMSRFREELGHTNIRTEAMRLSVSKIGSVITASALAVIVGLAGMAVARYQMIQTMGPVLGVAIFITLLAALTLAPALASVLGRGLFWPRHEEQNKITPVKYSKFWEKIAGFATGRPIIVIIILLAVMLIPFIPLQGLNRSFDQIAEIPENAQSVAGFRVLKDHFNIGEMDPLTAVIVAPDTINPASPEIQAALASISADLSTVAGVVKVQSMIDPAGAGQVSATAGASAVSPEIMQSLFNTFFSPDMKATRLFIVLDSYPQSDTALTTALKAREVIKSSIGKTALNGAEVVIGGTSAELADVRNILDKDINRVMLVVIIAIFLVLALLLRSLIAPIYLLLTVLLSYGATLGIVTWIFQGLMGQDGISFMIPIIVFVLLAALGSDYNIFLMSRVREESAKTETRIGTRLAAIVTGGVITACGIILAGTFGVLMITPIRTMTQVGAAVAIGVLIDTFLVRALLVPAIASVLGRWNWWPGKHGK